MRVSSVELTIRGLSIDDATTGRRLVDDLSVAVGAGEVIALTGPSGSGKTLAIRAALGATPAGVTVTSGTVTWAGPGVHGTHGWRRRHTGYAAQDPGSALRPDSTALRHVAESAVDRGSSRSAAQSSAHALLADLGLTSAHIDARAHHLSGGQAQRVVVARALVEHPELVILDEPTSGLDDAACAAVCAQIARRRNHAGATLVVTHDDRILRCLADQVVTTAAVSAVPRAPVARPTPTGGGPSALRLTGFGIQSARRQPLITDADLNIAEGELVVVTGPSGSGKTTLLRAICGLHRSDGELALAGRPIPHALSNRDDAALSALALVGQSPADALNPAYRVGTTLRRALHRGDSALSRRAAHGEAEALLDLVDVPLSALRRYPDQLSGGQRQRVALARALAGRPHLLVADEPTSALDSAAAERVVSILAELRGSNRSRGRRLSVLAATHDARLLAHADRAVEIVDGALVAIAPQSPSSRKEDPR